MAIAPALAESSDTNSTVRTIRAPGTSSTKRALTMSESAAALPDARRGLRIPIAAAEIPIDRTAHGAMSC
jgi:hypothetical protein